MSWLMVTDALVGAWRSLRAGYGGGEKKGKDSSDGEVMG